MIYGIGTDIADIERIEDIGLNWPRNQRCKTHNECYSGTHTQRSVNL